MADGAGAGSNGDAATRRLLMRPSVKPGATAGSRRDERPSRRQGPGVELSPPASRTKLLPPPSSTRTRHMKRAANWRRRAQRDGDCCAPPDFVREHVKNKWVLAALLIAMLGLSTRLSLGSQFFVLPYKVTGPRRIEFECPLVEPNMPSLHGFVLDLRQQLMPIVISSGMLWNPQEVDYQLLAKEAALATVATAESVFLPALKHAIDSERIPGVLAGKGLNSECDHLWLNVSTKLGMVPPPVVRGVGERQRAAPSATFNVSIWRLQTADAGYITNHVTDCLVNADGAGHAPLWYLLRGYPAGLYNVSVASVDHRHATSWLLVPVNDGEGTQWPESPMGASDAPPPVQVCPPPPQSVPEDAAERTRRGRRRPRSLSARGRDATRTWAGPGDGEPRLLVLSTAPAEPVLGGGDVNMTVRAVGPEGEAVANVPVTSWAEFLHGTRLAEGGFRCGRFQQPTQVTLTDASGVASFRYHLSDSMCNATAALYARVAGSDVVASMEFKTLVFPLRVYFKRILPEIMRINAGGPYGGLAPGSFVTTPDEFGGTDVGVAPAQPSYVTTIFSQLFGDLLFTRVFETPELLLPPIVCIDPPTAGKSIHPAVISVPAAHQIAMILEEFESAMSAQWLDKVDLNSTLARVVVAGLIGVPSVYPVAGAKTLAKYPTNDAYSTAVLPTLLYDETQVTDETGCVTFDSMTWTSGGNGPVIVAFGADANATAGWTNLVDADSPQSSQLGFVYERGLFDSFWLITYALLMSLACCLNKRCNNCGNCLATLGTSFTLFFHCVSAYATSWFYIEAAAYTTFPIIGYVKRCCEFSRMTFFNDVYAILVTILLAIATVYSIVSCLRNCCMNAKKNAIVDYVGELDWSQEVMRRLQSEGMGPGAYKPPQGDGEAKAPGAPASREREAKYVPLSAVDVEDALPAADDHATAGVPVALDVTDAPGPLVHTSPTWLAGARVYRELHAKAVAAAAREANVSWWGGFVMDDGFDDRRMRAYREAMPGLLRMQRRTVEGLKKTSVANALKKKAASSWTSYRGSMFAVGWRFVTAWKVYLLSIFYVFGAVWWLFYTVFVVSLGCLFTMGKIPASQLQCCWACCVNLGRMIADATLLTGVTGWEVVVLLWAALMDTMPFIPIGTVEPPAADADDASYDDPDVLTKSGRWVFDMTLVGRTRRWVRGRRTTCRRLCCDPRAHSTKNGNVAFSLRVQGKQEEVHSRFWTWIKVREDVSHGVRRRTTVTAFQGLRRAYNGSPDAPAGVAPQQPGEVQLPVSLPPVVDLPVFLPQRWWWSCIMSMFMVSLICCVGAVMATWLNQVFLESLHAYHSLESELDLHLALTSTHPPITRLEYVMGGYLLVKFQKLVGDGTYNIIMQIVPLGVPGAMLAVFLITSFVWWRMAVVYQHRIRELRMGRLPEARSASSCTAPMYIGYQLVHSIVGALFLSVIIILVAVFVIVSILVKPLQASLASGLLAVTLSVLPSAILWVVTRLWGMFLARDHILVYPVPFFYYDAISMLNNMVIGMLVVLKRLAILFAYITISFWRLDILAGGSTTFDTGYAAYLSMLMLDHTNNNPVKLVFLDIVRKEINVLRALKRGGVVKGNVNRQVYAMQQYDPTFVGWMCCLPCCCQKCACKCCRHPDDNLPEVCNVDRRVRRQRNIQRWHLYVMLIRNPSLQLYRKHRLRAETSFKKLAETTPHVAKFVRVKSRGIVIPWVASVARVGNDDQFAKSEQLVVVVDGYFNVFKSEEAQSPAVTLAFASVGAVLRLGAIPEFFGCGHRYGFALRALHKWYGFATRDQEEEAFWYKMLKAEQEAAAKAAAAREATLARARELQP